VFRKNKKILVEGERSSSPFFAQFQAPSGFRFTSVTQGAARVIRKP